MARVVIGDQQVQGLDYVYTLQGWLKGLNSISGDSTIDPGGDGKPGGANQYVARDIFGFGLNYFAGDYFAISSRIPFPGYSAFLPSGEYRPLYNGNISSQGINIGAFKNDNTKVGGPLMFYNYRYDQLNRLTGMDIYHGFNSATNSWTLSTRDSIYKERVGYDGNGNITRYRRNGHQLGSPGFSYLMDSLTYKYYPGTNRLKNIRDAVAAGNWGTGQFDVKDIDSQVDSNYVYDEIGNLIKDSSQKLTIQWNVYGKITQINHNTTTNDSATQIKYIYDAQGNRIGQVLQKFGTTRRDHLWYVRDAQGNVMMTYNASGTASDTALQRLSLSINDRYIYGSSRIGRYVFGFQGVDGGPADMTFYNGNQFYRGYREYELSNHLGNVMTTLSDKKLEVSSTTDSSLIGYYKPEVISAFDYYPFGGQMQGRQARSMWSLDYRYGFNGKETDTAMRGWGSQYDYDERSYDAKRGQWLSVDGRMKPDVSPYQFVANNPINYTDANGEDEIHFIETITVLHYPNGRILPLFRPTMSVVVVPKEGPDRFFYHKVDKVMNGTWRYNKKEDRSTLNWKLSGYVAKSVTEFFPRGDGPGGQGGLFKGTGVTTSQGGLPFMRRNDEDATSLAKLAPASLIKYLEEKDPKTYKGLALSSAGLSLGEAGQQAAGLLLLLEGGLSAFESSISSFKYGSLTNAETRLWYNQQLANINTKVAFTEENARMLSAQRNLIKGEARLLMKDRAAAAELDKMDPIRPFEFYLEKYQSQGFEGEALWKKIIEGSVKPNAERNKQFGIQ